MTERTKVGARVDAKLWNEFRENVKERKGQTRGVLGDELENALREYIRDETRPIDKRIEKKLTRIEHAVGAAEADGGADTLGDAEHTHAPSRLDVDGKPPANVSTDKKVAYLAECIRDEHAGEPQEVARSVLIDTVKEEYGFRSDTAKRYVESLVDYFDLRGHPTLNGLLVTEDRYAELVDDELDD